MAETIMFETEVDDQSLDYLQRLGYEVDSYRSIIDYLFTAHADEPDFIGTELFKSYAKEYAKVNAEYSKAKAAFGEKVLRPIAEERFGVEGCTFNWSIPDFADKTAQVWLR